MEGERSPIIDIMGDMSKAPLPEASTASSSSDTSSRGAMTLGRLRLLRDAFGSEKL
jgi:hypothetical protein